jgi:hypothetical protein
METYKCQRCKTVLQAPSSLRSETRRCTCGGEFECLVSDSHDFEAKLLKAQVASGKTVA